MAALSIEQVLAAEAEAIHGKTQATERLTAEASGQDAQEKRKQLNADQRNLVDPNDHDIQPREKFYRALNKLNRAALCCSGGGIRSATFCLGVIQGLAAYDVTTPEPPEPHAEPRKKGPLTEPENSLLGRLHYLSTVSGGGYVGSWLSSWRTRDDFDTIFRELTGRPGGADVEPPEISWLRAYSNYLTPRVGIASADSWAAVAIVARNLVLNWLVIIPVVCLVLLALKVIATGGVWIAHVGENDWFGDGLRHWPIILTLVIGVVCLVAAQAFTTNHRPPRRAQAPAKTPTLGSEERKPSEEKIRADETKASAEKKPDEKKKKQKKCLLCRRTDIPEKCFLCRRRNVDEKCFLLGDFVWAAISAIAVTIFFTSRYFFSWFGELGLTPKIGIPAVTALGSFVVYSLGWVAGCRLGTKWRSDYFYWAISGLIYGALVGFGAYLFTLLRPYASCACSTSGNLASLLTAIIFGVPWVLMAQLTADNIFGGFVSYEPLSDSDREWLGRAAGWLSAFAIAWAIVAFLVFAAGYFVLDGVAYLKQTIVASGGVVGVVSGIATALLGSSSKTPAKSGSDDQGNPWALAYNIALAVAGPVFAVVLIVALSIALDKLLLGDSVITILLSPTPHTKVILGWLLGGAMVTFIIAGLASYYVNINRFSLHALYRNRLTRGYLGASRQERHPDRFTGFDSGDNIRMWRLWPPKAGGEVQSKSLFHVVNIALNVVSTKRLAWQERKAEAFTVSPLHCGSAYLGFRPSKDYGDSLPPITTTGEQGIALGTAMAISGAAVSPNMGYHSSPSLALLLTLFNVRLGWWLGNPGEPGGKAWCKGREPYRREGPKWAAKPLFHEAFGQTTDQSRYVYLSDGGHFENLGLYEMVRRRCGFIVLVDAGCDPDFAFEDLGNAVRKIYIDLGIEITFDGLEALINRPSKKEIRRDTRGAARFPYFAIGTINYKDADKKGVDEKDKGVEEKEVEKGDIENGHIIYIKPAYHGDESAGIMAYAQAKKDFPHETTTDQWFTESQFESYRSLGMEIADNILKHRGVRQTIQRFLTRPAPSS